MTPDIFRPLRRAALTLVVAITPSGCGVVSQRKLDDSRLRIQALQAENEQLRDVALKARNENRDMGQRALEDARRMRALEEANRRLERSILAYQDETKQMAALLDQLRSQVSMATSDSPRVSLREQLQSLPNEHPEINFDPEKLALTFPSERLFDEPQGRLSPEAERWLDAIGARLRSGASTDKAQDWTIEIAAGQLIPADKSLDAESRHLAEATARWRMHKVRERLARASGLDPDRFVVGAPNEAADGVIPVSLPAEGRVELRVRMNEAAP
jgi:hypothetical protein